MKMENSKIVTLVGSTRFQEELIQKHNEFTMQGYIVLADLTEHDKQCEGWKQLVDQVHLEKIRMSDLVYVVNPNGYIGESTAKEINFAINIGKEIEYMEMVK